MCETIGSHNLVIFYGYTMRKSTPVTFTATAVEHEYMLEIITAPFVRLSTESSLSRRLYPVPFNDKYVLGAPSKRHTTSLYLMIEDFKSEGKSKMPYANMRVIRGYYVFDSRYCLTILKDIYAGDQQNTQHED